MGIRWVVSYPSSHASRPPVSSPSSGSHPRFSIVWIGKLDGMSGFIMPATLPKYILDLPPMSFATLPDSGCKFHTLRVVQAVWSNSTSPVCNTCDSDDTQDEKHVLFRCSNSQ
eukprot:1160260-Pelagomonas_calceolata.AAC.7